MTSAEKRDMHQTAVLWEIAGYRPDGEPVVQEPVEIHVRWTESDSEKLDPNSTQISASITVSYTSAIAVGSIMRLGTLAEASANDNDNLKQVIKSGFNCDLKGRHYVYTMELMVFNDKRPDLVGSW